MSYTSMSMSVCSLSVPMLVSVCTYVCLSVPVFVCLSGSLPEHQYRNNVLKCFQIISEYQFDAFKRSTAFRPVSITVNKYIKFFSATCQDMPMIIIITPVKCHMFSVMIEWHTGLVPVMSTRPQLKGHNPKSHEATTPKAEATTPKTHEAEAPILEVKYINTRKMTIETA